MSLRVDLSEPRANFRFSSETARSAWTLAFSRRCWAANKARPIEVEASTTPATARAVRCPFANRPILSRIGSG